MRSSNLFSNSIYSFLFRFVNIIFPFITYPYVARILLPEALGNYEFLTSISNIFILLASFGIPSIAIRELSPLINLKINKFEAMASNFFTLHFISSFILLTVFYFLYFLGIFDTSFTFFSIFLFSSFLHFLSTEWILQTFSDFKFILIKQVIIKTLSLILILLLVKSSSDIIIYIFITFFTSIFSTLMILFRSLSLTKLKVLSFSKLKFSYFKGFIIIFLVSVITSFYSIIDRFMLNSLGAFYLGLYSLSIKIPGLIINLISSLFVVLMPILSKLLFTNQKGLLKSIAINSFYLLSFISIPFAIFIFFFSSEIVYYLFSSNYNEAVISLSILSPTIFFVSSTYLFGMQLLISHKKEVLLLLSTLIGLVLNLFLNLVLTNRYFHIGSSLSLLFTEIVVFSIQFYFIYINLKIKITLKPIFNYLVIGIFSFGLVKGFYYYLNNSTFLLFIFASIVSFILYLFLLFLSKDLIFKKLIQYILKYIKLYKIH